MRGKKSLSATLFTINPARLWLEINRFLCGERLACNGLKNGAAHIQYILFNMPYINKIYFNNILIITKTFEYGKGIGHPRTCHERPKGEYRNSSSLSLTSVLK